MTREGAHSEVPRDLEETYEAGLARIKESIEAAMAGLSARDRVAVLLAVMAITVHWLLADLGPPKGDRAKLTPEGDRVLQTQRRVLPCLQAVLYAIECGNAGAKIRGLAELDLLFDQLNSQIADLIRVNDREALRRAAEFSMVHSAAMAVDMIDDSLPLSENETGLRAMLPRLFGFPVAAWRRVADALFIAPQEGYRDWKTDQHPIKRVRRIVECMFQAEERREHRQEKLKRKLGSLGPLAAELRDFASMIMVTCDLENATRDLLADQKTAVQLKFQGFTMPEVGDRMGWDPKRLDAVRRSLESDRSPGRELRQRLAPYISRPPDRKDF